MTNLIMCLWSRRSVLGATVGTGVAAVRVACGAKSEGAVGGGRVNVGSVTGIRAALASQQYVRRTEGRLVFAPRDR